jgi:hypothetical protein
LLHGYVILQNAQRSKVCVCCLIKNNESSNNEKMSEMGLWLNGATVVSVAFIRCSSGNLFDLIHSAMSSAFRKQTYRMRRQKGRMKMGEELLVMTENTLPESKTLLIFGLANTYSCRPQFTFKRTR